MSTTNEENKEEEKPIHLRLFDFNEDEIKEFNYYQILGLEEPVRATPYTIKQAYRKASIRYHPDKTGRGEDNYVFIAVKSAWDTLSDTAKRQAYDSTEMPFDDSIPPDVASSNSSNNSNNGLLYSDDDFYDTFGPVFERNLRFDTRLQQQTTKKNATSKGSEIPTLGDESTSIEDVQAFYDYWTQFTSWRDFSQKAQEELFDNNNPLEDAESRYEKRFYQKEIDKRAKALKRQEMNRIQTLVQRSMAADPRLQKYYREQKEAKEKAALDRKLKKEQEEREKKEAEELRLKEEAEREALEKEQRAQNKAAREKEKKLLRKAKQQLRKITVSTYQEQSESSGGDTSSPPLSIFKSLEDMSDEVEFLCSELNLQQIQELTQTFTEQKDFGTIEQMANERRNTNQVAEAARKQEMLEKQKERDEAERLRLEAQAQAKAWSQLELNALTKAIKKFPKTGGKRWEQIANFINNMCQPENPRTSEECLKQFNSIHKATMAKLQEKDTGTAAAPAPSPAAAPAPAPAPAAPAAAPAPAASAQVNGKRNSINKAASKEAPESMPASTDTNGGTNSNGNNPKTMGGGKSDSTLTEASSSTTAAEASAGPAAAAAAGAPAAAPAGGGGDAGDTWSEEQDKQLQEGLAKFPTTMDKNERWTSIAKMVTGKTKKQCVQRFKAIRDAIKSGKK